METSKIIGLIAICLCGLTTLFSILALALPSWLSKGAVSLGLWKGCSLSACINITPDSSTVVGMSFMAVRAMCFLAVFSAIGALATGILRVFIMTSNKMLGFLASGLAVAGGCFLLIGFAVYVAEISGNVTDFGAAFGLAVVGWLMAWVTGALFLVEARSTTVVA